MNQIKFELHANFVDIWCYDRILGIGKLFTIVSKITIGDKLAISPDLPIFEVKEVKINDGEIIAKSTIIWIDNLRENADQILFLLHQYGFASSYTKINIPKLSKN